MSFTGFGPDVIAFYEGLVAENTRERWQAHREVYDTQVRAPVTALAATLGHEFGPVKIFSPYNDLRFAPNRPPYRTNVAIAARRPDGTALYFGVSAEWGVDLGGGMFSPSRDQLRRFRDLQDDPAATASLDAVLTPLARAGFAPSPEDALTTAPRGWPRDHPRVALLRLRRLLVGQQREPGPWLCGPGCLDLVVEAWRTVTPWDEWLAGHVGPPTETSATPASTQAPVPPARRTA